MFPDSVPGAGAPDLITQVDTVVSGKRVVLTDDLIFFAKFIRVGGKGVDRNTLGATFYVAYQGPYVVVFDDGFT
jgi:hypothetical protein